MACGFQSGASNHHSPVTTSILPSLLTSAMATPSERNFLSTTIFFQVMSAAAAPLSPALSAGTAGRAASGKRSRASQGRERMGNLSVGWESQAGRAGHVVADDYGGCAPPPQRRGVTSGT